MVSQHRYEQVQHQDKVSAPPVQEVTSGGTSGNITTAVLPNTDERNQKDKKGDDEQSHIPTATTRNFMMNDDEEAVCCSVYENSSDNSSDAAAVRHVYDLIGILNDPEAQAKLPIISIADLTFLTPQEGSKLFLKENQEDLFVQKRFDAIRCYVRNGHHFDERTTMQFIVDVNQSDLNRSASYGCLFLVAFWGAIYYFF